MLFNVFNVTCGIWENLTPKELEEALGEVAAVVSVSNRGNITLKNRDTGETLRMSADTYKRYIGFPVEVCHE